MERISIIGLGWFGEALADEIQKEGFSIAGTTRGLLKKSELEKKKLKVEILNHPAHPSEELLSSKIIILNIPPFKDQFSWFRSWNWSHDSWVIFISSTSVQGTSQTENARILLEEEAWIQKEFSHWTILRFGGLIGEDRHPGKHLSGKANLPGRLWPVNLIHLEDCVGVTKAIIAQKIQNEVLTAVSPWHPTREEYYTEYCRQRGLPLPEFDQSDDSKKEAIKSERVESFYRFRSF